MSYRYLVLPHAARRHPLAGDAEEGQRTGRGRRDGHRPQDPGRLGGEDARRPVGSRDAGRRPGAGHRVPQSVHKGELRLDPSPRRPDGDLLRQQPKRAGDKAQRRVPRRRQTARTLGCGYRRDPRLAGLSRWKTAARMVPLRICPAAELVRGVPEEGTERKGHDGRRAGKNFPELKPVHGTDRRLGRCSSTRNGSIRTAAPAAKVQFEQLEDWTQRPEEARQAITPASRPIGRLSSFNPKSEIQNPRSYLDLGTVKNVARVEPQRPRSGRGLDRAMAGGDHRRGEARRERTGDRGGQPLAQPAHRRRDAAEGQAADRHERPHLRHADHGTYGCKKCEDRKKTGKPANLLPSGLLGPVRVMMAE